MGELVDIIGKIGLGDDESRSKDILGRVYEYFLGQFAEAEKLNATIRKNLKILGYGE